MNWPAAISRVKMSTSPGPSSRSTGWCASSLPACRAIPSDSATPHHRHRASSPIAIFRPIEPRSGQIICPASHGRAQLNFSHFTLLHLKCFFKLAITRSKEETMNINLLTNQNVYGGNVRTNLSHPLILGLMLSSLVCSGKLKAQSSVHEFVSLKQAIQRTGTICSHDLACPGNPTENT